MAAVCAGALIGWQCLNRDELNRDELNSEELNSEEPSSDELGGDEPVPNESVSNKPVSNESVSNEPDSAARTRALTPNATVLAVIDGDTIDVDLGGHQRTVRFIGIDTPEKTGGYLQAECGGDTASRRTAELLPPGTEVYLQRDSELYDRYDRLLAYVYRSTDGMFVNRYLVLDGYAATLHFEPNTHHRGVLDAAEAEARAGHRGIWSACGGPDRPLEGTGSGAG